MSSRGPKKIRHGADKLTEIVGETLGSYKNDSERERVRDAILNNATDIRTTVEATRAKQKREIHYQIAKVPNERLMEEMYSLVAEARGKGRLPRRLIKKLLILVEEEYGRPVEREDILRYYQEGKVNNAAPTAVVFETSVRIYLQITGLLPLPTRRIQKNEFVSYRLLVAARQKWLRENST